VIATKDNIGKLLGYGASFLEDWIANEGRDDPECREACDLMTALEPTLLRFPDLIAALRTAHKILSADAPEPRDINEARDIVEAALKGAEE
jgi:hypothetical protein